MLRSATAQGCAAKDDPGFTTNRKLGLFCGLLETTKVLNEAAVSAKENYNFERTEGERDRWSLDPTSTGAHAYQSTIVANKDEYERMLTQSVAAEEVNE